jgi:hypothetical protein
VATAGCGEDRYIKYSEYAVILHAKGWQKQAAGLLSGCG